MKVAVVTSYFPTSNNPWEGRSAYETLRILSSCCDVRVFCPVATDPRLLRPASRSGPQPDLSWTPQAVDATYVSYPVIPLLSRPLNGVAMAYRLLPHIRLFQPDILLNYLVYPDGYAAVRLGKILHIPVVLTAIGSDLNRMSDPLCRLLTQSALRRADVTTTVSGDLAKTAVSLGAPPEKVRTIRNGCDLAIFHPQSRSLARSALSLDLSSEIVLYVGRLDRRKGLIELVESIAALRHRRPALRCYIIGKGPDEALLRERTSRLAASDRITLIPPCTSAHIAIWMSAANLIALPSYKEGCPNVIIEALASGRPVVATNVGGIPELADCSCGCLVPPRDVASLTEALHLVLDKEWDAELIGSKHNRSWLAVAHDLASLLSEECVKATARN